MHVQSYPSTFHPLSLCLRDAPSILPLHVPPSLSLCLGGAPSILPVHVPPSLCMFKGCTFNLAPPRSTLSLYGMYLHLQCLQCPTPLSYSVPLPLSVLLPFIYFCQLLLMSIRFALLSSCSTNTSISISLASHSIEQALYPGRPIL